jgi:hypothetical protein
VQPAAVMAKLHRSQGDFLDRAFHTADVDIFTDTEGVIEQEEGA